LIHGGLRYLKYFQFRLVRESLRERATLLRLAPHLVEPLPFLIPMYGRLDRLVYGTGLRLYDLLAGSRNVGRHRRLDASEVASAEPGIRQEGLSGGAIFYDCRIHSARFVLENVIDAARNGVIAANYVRAGDHVRDGAGWRVTLSDRLSGASFEARARKIVDARGPWSDESALRIVRGSHLVFPRFTSGDRAIAHFDEAGRIVFFIPWGSRNQLTLIGTTDVDHDGSPDEVRISSDEVGYLRDVAGRLFPASKSLCPVSSFSSLRPLLPGESGSPTAASREHRIWNSPDGILRIAGGKYTIYRLMSEQAADAVCAEIAPQLSAVHLTDEMPLEPALGPRIEDLPLEAQVAQAVNREMAQRLADFLFVSTYLGYGHSWDASALRPYADAMANLLGWDPGRSDQEIALALEIVGQGAR